MSHATYKSYHQLPQDVSYKKFLFFFFNDSLHPTTKTFPKRKNHLFYLSL